mmetsp:Transcript_6722/g.13443  ORF Transcript_6722/g.13443 Transcript_6722/m.13443 type:complete len:215 (-) Transcript_6722:2758-3402(-)
MTSFSVGILFFSASAAASASNCLAMSLFFPSSPSPNKPCLFNLALTCFFLLANTLAIAASVSPFIPRHWRPLPDPSCPSPVRGRMTMLWLVLGLFIIAPSPILTSSLCANPTLFSSIVTGISATMTPPPSAGTMPDTASSFFSSFSSPSLLLSPSPPSPLCSFHSSSLLSVLGRLPSLGVSASFLLRLLGLNSSPVSSSLIQLGGSGSTHPLGM